MNTKSKIVVLVKHIIITLLAFCIVGVLAGIALNIGFLDPVAKVVEDFSVSDVYYQILQETGEPEENTEVTIVDMSDLYSRRELAKALAEIDSLEPRVVGVDVVFEGLKEDSIGDTMVWDIARTMENAVFSYRMTDYENDSIGFAEAVHSFFAEPLEVTEGFTNMQRELYGGMKRVLSLGRQCQGERVPSFVKQVAGSYARPSVEMSDNEDLTIDYSPTRFTVLAADSVSRHPEFIRDRLVLFGAMTDEGDMHYTPLGKMSGVELLAYAVKTLLQQRQVRTLPWWGVAILSFLLVLLTQTGWAAYTGFAQRRRHKGLRLLLSNSLTKSVLLFLWMIFLMWLAFIVFFRCSLDIRIGWALSAMAFLDLARNFYGECMSAINNE